MMNYNAIGYLVFLAVIFFVTFQIGWKFYKNGEVYIRMLMPEDPHLVQSINKLLLVGYYLLNLGYASISISSWPQITSEFELLSYLSDHVGFIILMLALIHYFNLVWLLLYSRYIQRKHSNNNTINV
jgi:hypothetical protein